MKPVSWPKLKIVFVVGAAVLLVIGILVTLSPDRLSSGGRMKLPVGSGTPAISLGETHGVILASDGSLWSWGSDFLGWPVLGLGKVTAQTRLCRIGKDSNWIGISASHAHNLAIKSDGTLWAWGENIYGEFGVGTTARQLSMTNMPMPAAAGHDWKQAAAGGCFSLGLKTNGTLWAWGNNWAGPLGIGSTSNSAVPVRVGRGANWTKIWAGLLESVAMQSDGSVWYWGQNPDPAIAQTNGQILVPTRVSPDTNWVDVGMGEATVFGIKSDGTLWAWGRNAHVYTGVTNTTLNVAPLRVGTNTDWRNISACGLWWCQGLTKRDGSLWFMDASDSKPNGPRPPFKPVQFRRVTLAKEIAAYTAGAAHAPAPGHHEPLGVVLTRDGEVWTWGMVLGDPSSLKSNVQAFGKKLANSLHLKINWPDPGPVLRERPWQIPNLESADGK